ncbi:MAG TPA: TetR/AcrR family transcriptional regulator [Chloroflexi bacterium]|nr:TetR/AcrR family transcriptional regulator [Chloroflexota bacterium]
MEIREDIVKAAAHVFSRDGYQRATLEDVAQLVGIKKGSLYHHISSKEDLLFAIHDRLADELIANTRAALQGAETPADRLRRIMRVSMRLIAEHQEEVTVFLHERHTLTSERWQAVVAKRDEYEQIVAGVLAEGIEAGVFRPLPVRASTLGILGMINWGYQWFRPDGPLSADEIADLFTDIVLDGVRRRDSAGGKE